MKSQIIRQLGQTEILLPELVKEALAANDRIKVRMSALQAAAQHAQRPDNPATDLAVESRAAGLAEATLATLIRGARLCGGSHMTAPNLAELMKAIRDEAQVMVRAVGAGNTREGEAANARLAAIDAAGLLATNRPCLKAGMSGSKARMLS